MRTFVDVSLLARQHRCSGQGNAVYWLLHELARLEDGSEYVLAAPAPEEELCLPDFPASFRWRYRPLPRLPGRRGGYLLQHAAACLAPRLAGADVAHFFLTPPAFAGRRTVVTVWDMMLELFPEYQSIVRSRPYRLARRGIRRAGRVVTISESARQDITRLTGRLQGDIDIISLGVAPVFRESPPGPPEAAGREGRYILSIDSLERRKNLLACLRAFGALAGRPGFEDIRLVLYGSGGAGITARDVEALIGELGIRERVVRRGRVDDAEVARLHRGAAAFLFLSAYEGFGLPILEAMCSGAPVVAADSPAAREIGGDGVLLVEPARERDVADALARAVGNPSLRARLASAARQQAEHYSYRRGAEQLLRTYAAVARAS